MPKGRTAALRRWIHSARNVRLRRLRSRKAYCWAFSTACLAMRMVFLRRPEKPFAAFRTFLCLAWDVTTRFIRAMTDLLYADLRVQKSKSDRSAVGQPVFLDVVAVGLEQHVGAAQLADLLLGPLDHAVTFARVGRQHLAGAGNLEALFGA